MPNKPPATEVEYPLPRRARDEAHVMLGQVHGVLWVAANNVETWFPEQTKPGEEPGLTAEDIRTAAGEIHQNFGKVHAALNTGKYDQSLAEVGINGAQGHAKRKGILRDIVRLVSRPANAARDYVVSLRNALRWSGTIVGSIATALQEEAKRFPGAATAAEGIKEFIEVLLNATEEEPASEGGEGKPSKPRG
jgi:hypothetical protein